MTVDELAIEMRHALNKSQTGKAPISWDKANKKAKKEWRVCARAALEYLKKKELTQNLSR